MNTADLTPLAKRDREFRTKASARFEGMRYAIVSKIGLHTYNALMETSARWNSARAIAREEGRAL